MYILTVKKTTTKKKQQATSYDWRHKPARVICLPENTWRMKDGWRDVMKTKEKKEEDKVSGQQEMEKMVSE